MNNVFLNGKKLGFFIKVHSRFAGQREWTPSRMMAMPSLAAPFLAWILWWHGVGMLLWGTGHGMREKELSHVG
jgi:hypothetical protein